MTGLPILDQPQHVKGELELALAALWREKSEHFYSLRNVPTILRLRRRFSLTMVNLDKLKVAVPRTQVPDCDACVDLCCTGPNAVVSLRLRDIAALLDRGRADVIGWDRPPSPKQARWARQEADGSVFHRAFPVLKRDETGTCVMLDDQRMCGLFPSWPLSCARYPYALDLQAGVIFYAKSCTSTKLADVGDAPLHVRRLVNAVVDAYNARIQDIVLLATARPELQALGLLDHVRVAELGL